MFYRSSHSIFIFLMVLAFAVAAYAQDTSSSVLPKPPSREDYPKTFKETLEKLRIEREKKEYQEMLDRGTEVLKITEELEKAVAQNGRLSETEIAKVASVEKLVKKIRGELGGDDEEDDKEIRADAQKSRLSPKDAIKSLHSATVALMDELKKTTRFSISAAAIQSSNAVLRVAKFLRFTN
jgi:hypothetical protein